MSSLIDQTHRSISFSYSLRPSWSHLSNSKDLSFKRRQDNMNQLQGQTFNTRTSLKEQVMERERATKCTLKTSGVDTGEDKELRESRTATCHPSNSADWPKYDWWSIMPVDRWRESFRKAIITLFWARHQSGHLFLTFTRDHKTLSHSLIRLNLSLKIVDEHA